MAGTSRKAPSKQGRKDAFSGEGRESEGLGLIWFRSAVWLVTRRHPARFSSKSRQTEEGLRCWGESGRAGGLGPRAEREELTLENRDWHALSPSRQEEKEDRVWVGHSVPWS